MFFSVKNIRVSFCKQFMERCFLKRMNAQKLQSSVQRSRQFQLLVRDGHQQVNRHRNPDLGLHRVGTGPVIMLDAQVSFDPPKEQFDLPAQPVKARHGQPRQVEMIGQENQIPVVLRVVITDPAQRQRKVLVGFGQGEGADLIAAQSRRRIYRPRNVPGKTQVVLGPGDKESPRAGQSVQPLKIQIAPVHDIKSSGLEYQLVEPKHVVLTGFGDMETGRNGAAQVELRVQLEARLGPAKVGPRKQRQRKIDGRRVEGINRVRQFQPEFLAGVKSPGFAHEIFGQVFPEPPVPLLVGIGQCRLGQWFAKAQMKQRGGSGIEAIGDIPQALPPSQLGEGHGNQLLPTAKMADTGRGIVTIHQPVERLAMDQIEELRQDKSAGIHGQKLARNSKASHLFLSATSSF